MNERVTGRRERRPRLGLPVRRRLPASALVLAGLVCSSCLPNGPASNVPARPLAGRAVPKVARVVCDEHGAAAPTRRVRAQRDGVHIIVENRSNARELYIRDAEEEGWNHGGRLKAYEANDIRTTLPPGEILIGCFRNIGDAPYSETNVPEYARITIVDPDRLWIPIGLACDDARSAGTFDAGRIVADPPASYEHIAREFVPGLKSTDELVRPGYPLTGWHGEPRLILREGEAVAHLDLYRQHSRWEVRVDACPGEDIGQNDI